MRKPEFVNIYKDPKALKEGDIIGFDQFSGRARTDVKASSGLQIEDFVSTDMSSRFRGMVLFVNYDPQQNDRPVSLVVMPMAPVQKGVTIKNDEKNLMLTRKDQIGDMGLSTDKNWRLNYMPITLDIAPKNFGVQETGKIVRFGSTNDGIHPVIMGQVKKLYEMQSLHTTGLLPTHLAQQLKGREIGRYDRVIGPEARVGVHGNVWDAKAAAEIEAQAKAEVKAAKKQGKAEAARAMKEEMRGTPSGRVAFNLGLRFNREADPDITIDNAFEADLLDEDTYLFLDDLKKALGSETIRTFYDAFVKEHETVLETLISKRFCTEENAEEYKALQEHALKSTLTNFYRLLQKNGGASEPEIGEAIIPYTDRPRLDL